MSLELSLSTGVVIGVVVGLILKGFDWLGLYLRRQELKKSIAGIIREYRHKKGGREKVWAGIAGEVIEFKHAGNLKVSKHQMRFVIWESFHKRLGLYVEQAETTLKYQDKMPLLDAVNNNNKILLDLGFSRKGPFPPVAFYEDLLGSLEEIKWVKKINS